jgi:hypothetical protein
VEFNPLLRLRNDDRAKIAPIAVEIWPPLRRRSGVHLVGDRLGSGDGLAAEG